MKNENTDFKYYSQEESQLHTFYMIPKELTTNSRYKHISNDAKFLYGLLRDRNQLSIKNNWVDAEGHIYIIYTRDDAMEILNVSNKIMVKIFKELTEVALIHEVRQGLNKPNIIYVGKISLENGINARKCKNYTSGSVKTTLQEVKKLHASNTNINNTNINKTHTEQKILCVEIKKSIGVSEQKTKDLINKYGIEKVKDYLQRWDKYKGQAKQQASYFIYCIENDIPEPTATKQTANKPQYANFEQREYNESDYEKFYANLS